MGRVVLDESRWRRLFSRTLLVGPPNSWKTSSLLTWPRPIHILSVPGEKGGASIPVGMPGVEATLWEEDPKPVAPRVLVKEFEHALVEILTAGYETVAVDGLHKLYDLLYEAHLAEQTAAMGDVEKARGPSYGLAHAHFVKLLTRLTLSDVPHVVATVWDTLSRDSETDKSRDASRHIWPDFPGRMAKLVLGEFGSVLYSIPGAPAGGGKWTAGKWLTRPDLRVWGCGLKIPAPIAPLIPSYVPQDWASLEALVLREYRQYQQQQPTTPAKPTTKGENP